MSSGSASPDIDVGYLTRGDPPWSKDSVHDNEETDYIKMTDAVRFDPYLIPMLKVDWDPFQLIIAARAIRDTLSPLGELVWSFKGEAKFIRQDGVDSETGNPILKKHDEPSALRTRSGLIHQTLFRKGLDINNMRHTGGDKVDNIAIQYTLELGEQYEKELQRASPRIVLPLSNIDDELKRTPEEARGAPLVPVILVWEATELVAKEFMKLPMDVLVKSPAEIWDALQGKAKMRAGDGTENPQPGTLAREFSIFIETPLFHDPEASSLLAREDCSVRPTLQSIEEFARHIDPKFKSGRAGKFKKLGRTRGREMEILKLYSPRLWLSEWNKHSHWHQDPEVSGFVRHRP